MTRWLPRSLFGRVVLLLTVGMVGAQLLGASLHLSERYNLLSQTISTEFAQQIAAAYRTVNTQPEEARASLVSSLSRARMMLALEPESASGASNHVLNADSVKSNTLVSRFETELQNELGPGVNWHILQVPGVGDFRFVVQLALSDGQWLRVSGEPPQEVLGQPWHLLLGLGVMLLVIVVLVIIVARSTVRPLTRFALAAHGVADNLKHPPLVEEGPSEVREAARAFNAMQRRIREGIEERERFLAAVSHDLKTPVTRLRLRAEMLTDARLRDDIEHDVNEMQKLIDDTLDFLRGRSVDEPLQPIDLVALVESVADDFSYGDQVTVDAPEALRFMGRPTALQRALRNLVDNAVKYGHRAHITLRKRDADVIVTVDDEGDGICAEHLDAVFEPFYRVEGSRSRDTGGSGLGLAIVRLVAQSHGGVVRLSNRPDGGLRAELELPTH